LVVTADEALAEDGDISVLLSGGESLPASLAGRDPTTDIVLLRIGRTDIPSVTLSAEPVATGELAVIVGAQDGAATAALGLVSHVAGAWRSMRGGAIDARIELAAGLRRSDEGGLAFNAAGQAIGMAVFGPRRRVLVIPPTTIERVATRLETHGRIARGYLGLALQPVRLEDGGIGMMVMSVDASGPGAAAGVRQGDVIHAWDGEAIRGLPALLRALGPDRIGTNVTFTGTRAGAPIALALTIGERQPA
jgi:S1-C subfamily serine protease